MDNTMRKIALMLFIAVGTLFLSGCLVAAPKLNPSYTPIPTVSAEVPEETLGDAEETPDLTPTSAPIAEYDALGRLISGNQHYMQYLLFHDIQVYEQADDTFMDIVVKNEYTEPIICAIAVRFFDEYGEEVATSNLRMQNGQYILTLEPGENYIYAQIDTDMTLLSLEFTLEYDMTIGVLPSS
ncbi:MAG: hypothetical protein IJA35_02895 [Clostridia bacterium]|nr:hypothetical protein [Clostridia bacterium]